MSGFAAHLVLLLVLVSVSLSPWVRCLGKERTLAMIKPDGVSGNYTEEIKRIVVEAGFNIVKERLTQLDKETASAFYDEHSSRSFFPHLVSYMTSGPVVVMVLEKRDAVSDWRGLIGPTDAQKAKISHPHSIRALCGKDSQRNCVHGSDSTPSAEREIKFFFKDLVSDHVKQESREEFSDWPHALLAIGTFGSTSIGVSQKERNNVHEEIEEEKKSISHSEPEEEPSSSADIDDFTPEEAKKLQKELMKILSRTKKRKSDVNRELMKNLPLDRFLNCPSSLNVERRISNALCAVVDSSEESDDMERTINVILGRCKEISIESKKNKKKTDISKTSVSYLFKKIFVCADGFSTPPNPSLRDTLQESRMEKLLKMMLHKKINVQSSSKPATSTTQRCLQGKKQLSLKSEEKKEETNERRSSSDGHKWVKTDSDCEFSSDSH
ncbi:unnamed protein product [Brassica oleracea var. botrytis]